MLAELEAVCYFCIINRSRSRVRLKEKRRSMSVNGNPLYCARCSPGTRMYESVTAKNKPQPLLASCTFVMAQLLSTTLAIRTVQQHQNVASLTSLHVITPRPHSEGVSYNIAATHTR